MTQIFNKRSQIVKRKILRKNSPNPEKILWQAIRNRKINGLKFKRQISIGRYVVDFYCSELQIIIEIDGKYHTNNAVKEYDKVRQEFLESLGLYCLRFSNDDIEKNVKTVLDKIESVSLSLRRRGIEGEV